MAASFVLGQVFLPIKYAKAQDTALEPSFSYLSATQDKNDTTTGQVDSTQEVNISGVSLDPTISNCEAAGSSACDDPSAGQIEVHVVKSGETVAQIADMFNVSANTILWANGMKKGDKLVEGDTLIILPIDGLKHTVAKGDTLKKIAAKYKADVSDIVAVNDVTLDSDLVVGQELIIPDAELNDNGGDKPAANLAAVTKRDQEYYAKSTIKNASGYFINPLASGHKTQGLHDHNRAIDIGAPIGTPIRAAASGTVLFAKNGWNGGFGNLVILNHLNGTQTYYAHQSKLGVSAGEKVSQGEIIGYVGSTGHSTGPHLHFEVRGARNPGADWSWKY